MQTGIIVLVGSPSKVVLVVRTIGNSVVWQKVGGF
jgi:hypothetical protein